MGNAQVPSANAMQRRAVPVPCGTSWFDLVRSGLGRGSSLLPCELVPCRKFTGDEPGLFGGRPVLRTVWELPPAAGPGPGPGLDYALGGCVDGVFVAAPARRTFEGGLRQPFLFRGAATEPPDVALEFDPDTGTAVFSVRVDGAAGPDAPLAWFRPVRHGALWEQSRLVVVLPPRSAGAPQYRVCVESGTGTVELRSSPDAPVRLEAPRLRTALWPKRAPPVWVPATFVGDVAPPRFLCWADPCRKTVFFFADEGGCVREDTRQMVRELCCPDARSPWPTSVAYRIAPQPVLWLWRDIHFVALYASEPAWLRSRIGVWLRHHPGCRAVVWGCGMPSGGVGRERGFVWPGFADWCGRSEGRVVARSIADVERAKAAAFRLADADDDDAPGAEAGELARELGGAWSATGQPEGEGEGEGPHGPASAERYTERLMFDSDLVRLVALYLLGGCYADVNDSYPVGDLRHVALAPDDVAAVTENCGNANNALIIAPRPFAPVLRAWIRRQRRWREGGSSFCGTQRCAILDSAVAVDAGAPLARDRLEQAPQIHFAELRLSPLALWVHSGDRPREFEWGDVCGAVAGTNGTEPWWPDGARSRGNAPPGRGASRPVALLSSAPVDDLAERGPKRAARHVVAKALVASSTSRLGSSPKPSRAAAT